MFTPENIGILVLVYLVAYLLYIIYYAIGLYHINPFIRLKPLSTFEKGLIADNFPIYSKLPPSLKEKCNKRIVWFRCRKKFVFYGEVPREKDLKIVLSATVVLMTLGMRDYKMMSSLLRIIVYPTQYYSRIKRRHHLGEYNPNFKTVIVSADTIWKGFEIADDNRNLAMHEFAHALSFDMMKKNSWQARKFRVGLKKIKQLFLKEAFARKVIETPYFREYGRTNLQEFFSVAVENYVETPAEFLKEFPELFHVLRRMLNFDFQYPPVRKVPRVTSL